MGLLDQLFARKTDASNTLEEAFKDDRKRPLEATEVDRIATLHGDLEVCLGSGKKWVPLAKAGALIPARYRERLKQNKMKAWIEAPSWDWEYTQTAQALEGAFKREQEEFILLPGQLLRPIAQEWILPYLSLTARDPHYLDLIAITEHITVADEESSFFDALQAFEDESIFWFQRSSRCAALAFHFALLLGYYEKTLLKEYWKATLFKDMGIVKKKYHLSSAHQQLVKAVQGIGDFPDLDSAQHGSSSWAWMQSQSFQISDYTDWMQACFEQHHEKNDGSGPLGLGSSHLIELARLQGLCDRICDDPAASLQDTLKKLDREGSTGLCPVLLGRLKSLCKRLKNLSLERVRAHAG